MSDEFDNPQGEISTGLSSGFRAAVTHGLIDLGYTVASWEIDGVNVRPPKKDKGDEQYIGLSNLYRRAKGADKAEWPKLIREFLEHLTGVLTGPKIPDDLNSVVDKLRPRLGRPFSREGKTHPWGVPLPGTGLEINLVIDYPHTMAYVTEAMLKKTGKSGEDLLDVAMENLKANTPPDFLDKVSEELDIFVGHTADGYDAARALLVEDLLPESPAGFWVVIPSRDELAVWPVSFEALPKIHVIKLFAQDNFQDHAYPVTDDVFWVWRGTWYRFGIQVDDKNLTVSPPDEFMLALKELEGDEDEAD